MKMIYGVGDYPKAGQLILFALQQLLAILAATIAVPLIIGNGMSVSAALFGAGVGTIVYLLFTQFKSPVFLGSSFAFLGSMGAAFAGGVSMSLGYLGLLIGAVFAGLVYVVIAVVVHFVGVKWIDKVMPAVVIGPTVAIIGLSLAGNAVGDLLSGSVTESATEWVIQNGYPTTTAVSHMVCSPYVALICGLIALGVTIACSVYGKKLLKMIPFVIGILTGYVFAAIFTAIGYIADADALKIIDFSLFAHMEWYPDFAFITAFSGNFDAGSVGSVGAYIGTIAVAYLPVAFVVFAEHLADHKNISSIIETDLLKDPGLSRTLLGDGVGSIAGAFFGGCPNTTYGESVGCVAISGNASVVTILLTACIAMVLSFVAPFSTFLATIPKCVMGGVCVALYGFIAVSGLKMIQSVDLNDNRNLFVVSVILIFGVGGMSLSFGSVTVTEVASALIFGILTNLLVNIHPGEKKGTPGQDKAKEPADQAPQEVQAVADSVQNAGSVSEVSKPVGSAKKAQKTKKVQGAKKVQSAEPVESPKKVQNAEPVQSAKEVQSTEPVESIEPVQSTEPVESVEPVQSTEPVASAPAAEQLMLFAEPEDEPVDMIFDDAGNPFEGSEQADQQSVIPEQPVQSEQPAQPVQPQAPYQPWQPKPEEQDAPVAPQYTPPMWTPVIRPIKPIPHDDGTGDDKK